MTKKLFLFLLLPFFLFSEIIESFYGPLQVDEPVLLELIHHPNFQRLKKIHQYGVSYYTTHPEEYNRYDHSIGVFAILRRYQAPLKEQIAGLLHDVSHTVFSHVGDWIFHKEYQELDYQGSIHVVFLEQSGLATILRKYNYTPEELLPKEECFPMLEQKCPDLCADRIDYNIQGAFFQKFITKEEAIALYNSFMFVDGQWICKNLELAKKIVSFSLFMSENCWGSARNHFDSRLLADAILRGLEIGLITSEMIHFGSDEEVWERLQKSEDLLIRKKMETLLNPTQHFKLVNSDIADDIIVSKFRGINPWICLNNQIFRLTNLDEHLNNAFYSTKERMSKGWAIQRL